MSQVDQVGQEVTDTVIVVDTSEPKQEKAPRAKKTKVSVTVEDSQKKKRAAKVKVIAEGGASAADADADVINVELPKDSRKRSFTVVSVMHDGQESDFKKGGRFLNYTPAGAARKAANQACKFISAGSDEPCTVIITIREVTKNRTEKDYSYEATRKLSEKKVDFKKGGVELNFKYNMVLKSLRKNSKGQVIAVEEVTNDEATIETTV